MAVIRIITNGNKYAAELNEGENLLIGREGSSQGIFVIQDQLVSKRHLRFTLEDGILYAEDMDSTNGTWLNQVPMAPLKKYSLALGDKIILTQNAVADITIQEVSENSFKQSNPMGASKVGLAALLQSKTQIFIGRNADCDMALDDVTVSRKHVCIEKKGNDYFIEDLGSTNGTFVNQNRIKAKVKVKLTTDDIIYIGLHAFSLVAESRNLNNEYAIQAVDVLKVYKNGNVGLQPINIAIQGQQMVALMGPSGCGKSTLLKALNGDSPASGGHVFLFGLELNQHYALLKQKIGYVPQDDIVHPDLNVIDTLYYAAKLRLADDVSNEDIEERISQVLTSLNINEPKIRNTKVASLSGGQRKRISIAVELLNKPSILFLDEPTSPLDPETIEEFLKCLRNLCNEGTTVVMVTHKPEDLDFVDKMIFLGTHGYHVYEGTKENFLKHFCKKHIVEVYALLHSEKSSKEWSTKWSSAVPKEITASQGNVQKDRNTNVLRQFYWLTVRYFHLKISNIKNLALLIFQPILIATLLIFVYPNLVETVKVVTLEGIEVTKDIANIGVIFFMAVAAVWFGVSNSAREIIAEKFVYRRERMYNLKNGNYFFSKWIVLSFISLVQLLIFLLMLKVFYQDDLSNFALSLLFLLFISASAILFGLLLSALSGSPEEVMSILPVALMPQIILAGVISPLKSHFTELLSYITFGRWGAEGLSRIQDLGREGELFMGPINANLYNDEMMMLFNTLQANIMVISMVDLGMIIGIFYALGKMEKSDN